MTMARPVEVGRVLDEEEVRPFLPEDLMVSAEPAEEVVVACV